MFIPHPSDERHNANMIKLLRAILGDNTLSNHLMFKGGTCAAMRDILPRFSIDLDFDITTKDPSIQRELKHKLHTLFRALKFRLDDESQHHL